MGRETSGRLLYQTVRKISREAVRIKKKVGAHPKVYSKEVL